MSQGYIIRMGARMILMTLIGAVLIVSVGFISARTSAGMAYHLRRMFYDSE
jgi:hypothetical protein